MTLAAYLRLDCDVGMGRELVMLLRVAIPLIRPAIVTAGPLTFIGRGSEFR